MRCLQSVTVSTSFQTSIRLKISSRLKNASKKFQFLKQRENYFMSSI